MYQIRVIILNLLFGVDDDVGFWCETYMYQIRLIISNLLIGVDDEVGWFACNDVDCVREYIFVLCDWAALVNCIGCVSYHQSLCLVILHCAMWHKTPNIPRVNNTAVLVLVQVFVSVLASLRYQEVAKNLLLCNPWRSPRAQQQFSYPTAVFLCIWKVIFMTFIFVSYFNYLKKLAPKIFEVLRTTSPAEVYC
jgi:uncharacterized membrane protein YidH (DUF202 family)